MIELLHIKTCGTNEEKQMAKKLIFKAKSKNFLKAFDCHPGAKGKINYLLLYQPSSL